MNLMRGNLYTIDNRNEYDLIGFTANSVVNNGKLVMGAGNALACKKFYPGIESAFGKKIKSYSEFNIIALKKYMVVAIQTKVNWRDGSDIELVKRTIDKLGDLANSYPDWKIGCPFPAINYGGLSRESILPLLESLPNNVDIWEY